MKQPSDTLYRIALLAVAVVACGLRLFQLDAQSLWYDEGVTAIVAQYDLSALARWTADDIQPPLYYALVAGWGRLFDWSEWSLRAPSALFGTLTPLLLAALTRRWSSSRLAAVLAGLFAAVHPLLVYYSQEARMYSLLLGLCVVAAYCAVPSAYPTGGGRKQAIGWWAAYTLSATAALYTHYFAAFFLLAVVLAHLMRAFAPASNASPGRRKPQSAVRALLPALCANAAVLLLYAPWLGTLFARLQLDSSYWPGRLKLWETLRAVAISFTSGETVLEADATRLLWMYAAVTALALVGSWQQMARGDSTRRFGPLPRLLYPLLLALVPVAGALALAAFTPKFNPRYVLTGLPGLILLWGAGLAWLLAGFRPVWMRLQRKACNTRFQAAPTLAGLVVTGLLLSGFVFGTANWFARPAFTKDQWRELVGYVQANRQPGEAVVLVSGHAWPIWRYYAPQTDPLRLPEIEILDVNAALNLSSAPPRLRAGLADATGAWLVNWQADVIDPTDVAGYQLAQAGEEQPVPAQFWGLGLRHYTGLEPAAIAPPANAETAQARFGTVLELASFQVDANGDLLLFWRLNDTDTAPAGEPADYHLTLQTFTADGLLFAQPPDRRLTAYTYPVFRWQPGQLVLGRVPAADWLGPGAPAGAYRVRLGVYDPAGDVAGLDVTGPAGERLGKQALLQPVVDQPVPLAPGEEPTAWHEISAGVFVKPTLATDRAEPGQPVALQLLWYAPEAQAIGALVSQWNEQAQAIQWDGQRQQLNLRLPAGQVVRTLHRARPPGDLPPGAYWLELTVDRMPTRPLLLPFAVTPSTRNFQAPALAQQIDAAFGGQVLLQGLPEPLPETAQAGQSLSLAFSWQALRPERDYALTVQWLDRAGRPAAQLDQPLNGGASNWLPGEVISQIMSVPVPGQPGPYRLIVAVYDPDQPGLPRLRLASGRDFVELGQVTVEN